MNGEYDVSKAEFLFYDQNGLIVFNQKEIIQYDHQLTKMKGRGSKKPYEHLMLNNNEYYTMGKDFSAFYFYNRDDIYAVAFDTENFTYGMIPLEQRIKEYKDHQKIEFSNELEYYFLYDDLQYTLYKNENIKARQWFELPSESGKLIFGDHEMTGSPIFVGDKILWVEREGTLHCLRISK